MNRTRERFNAKARQSVAGSHKKKKGKRSITDKDPSGVQEPCNPNADIVVPKSEEQKELDRKEKLKQEVRFPYSSGFRTNPNACTFYSYLHNKSPRFRARRRNGWRNTLCVYMIPRETVSLYSNIFTE